MMQPRGGWTKRPNLWGVVWRRDPHFHVNLSGLTYCFQHSCRYKTIFTCDRIGDLRWLHLYP